MNFKLIPCTLAILSLFTSLGNDANAMDVIGKNFSIVVKRNSNKNISFLLCQKNKNECLNIGSESGYTLEELKKIQSTEQSNVNKLVGKQYLETSIPAIKLAASVIGTVAGAFLTLGAPPFMVVELFFGAKIIYYYYDQTSFTYQQNSPDRRKLNSIQNDIIEDNDFYLDDESVKKIAYHLSTILENAN